MDPVRCITVWCPDWPVVAAAKEAGCARDAPVAVIVKGRVYACNAPARADGVRRDLRVREAQARCPDLAVLPYDPAVDARAFEPIVAAVEAIAPGVEVIRPGMCAVRARGPARYFGGEEEFADRLCQHLAEQTKTDVVIGIADGPFAAEQAARQAERTKQHVHVFPPGESAEHLAGLNINLLDRPDLVDLLRRLGIRTLGAFAALPAGRVLERFGIDGALAHRLASGHDDRPFASRRPPPELATSVEFEPPLDRVDQVAFAIKSAAEHLVEGLADRDLVCTCLRVDVTTERGADAAQIKSRQWRHPRWFSANDVVDRVRWQLQGLGSTLGQAAEDSDEATFGVLKVQLFPEDAAPTGAYQDGLWGDQAPDERVHRALTRVQSMLGHEAVLTAILSGGRSPADRVTFVPWGDEPAPARAADQPWPGQLPDPPPSTVLTAPTPVEVLGADQQCVELTDRGLLTTTPTRFDQREIEHWAGPWLVEERWWDAAAARRYARFQVVCADGAGYALLYERGRWWLEASYD